MHFEITVEIKASAETVWNVLTDVETWPQMTDSIEKVEIQGSGPFGKGSTARVKQPRLPAAEWTVTDFETGKNFTWASKSPGVTTTAGHVLTEQPGGTVTVRHILDQTGPLAPLTALLLGRLSRRYVEMEAQGLKRKSESA
ncbi:SRPBCC family protein [Actinomadura barringtoniae]|uniref:SRPBCC family protein n=1 Tax=Actinomadura barringtoniae TaxID=1427535 RepID=A0A939T3F5_9ACTN|nr:SRPBCC family protein [Actinomadura barringtoniae]MBO2446574.1 SRPBCC family protein [Actinomadura barringtoniae]